MVNLNDEIKQVDLSTRTIYLNTGVDSNSVTDGVLAILNINAYDNQQEAKLKDYVRQPIKLVVDSYGGSVYDGLGLINAMTSSKTPVDTYCYSKAMSMGMLLLISGRRRYVHEFATVMFHQLSGGTGGTNQDIIEDAERINELNNMLMKIVKKRTKITKEQIKDKNEHKKDWFVSGKKAIKLGMADELIKDVY